MGRPREFNEDQALEQAMNQFWSKGYEATSLQDLLGVMRLSKSSFYQTFHSKHTLLNRAIGRYRQMTTRAMLDDLNDAPSARRFIVDLLLRVARCEDPVRGRWGCLVVNCAGEFAQSDPVIARAVADSLDEFKAVFLSAVQQGQRDGDIPADRDPAVLADYLVSCKSGLEMMAKAGSGRQRMEEVVHVMISALH